MARHAQPDPPRVHGKAAVGQWVLLVVFGLITLTLGVFTVVFVVLAVRESAFGRLGFPMALALGLTILFGSLARNRIYRIIGKDIPPDSGGGIFV
ncbi:hypothetical protein EV191_10268 [Tamaricihabitans halophyticus]|uniref:Uncharacterized protein n=1 Tax=Tamaricihabitans halophyticus TaxID=1262583 RepID=A0A4R2R010_9PSEU|nr:hypothetical protein [Tamaricihabitans halophyticus]TCP54859.1 hypothetical protein EV191_10268 [Tamaricihabitans halophyticus]